MNERNMKATTLTGVLIGIILLVVVVTVGANWQLQNMLSAEITTTNNLKRDADESSNNLAKAKNLQTYMQLHSSDVEKAASIIAETKTYQYQNQIIEDVTRYANAVGLSILEFNFPESTASATKKTTNTLKSITAEVTLRKPVEYTNFIRFLKYIEQNLTKMQITDISITPNPDNPKLIDSPTVGLEVYIK